MTVLRIGVPLAVCLMTFAAPAVAQSADMSFFVTSVGIGNGGDLGGVAGADAHCQKLADAAGAGTKTWHAYLSTQGQGAVNARDRIGKGPWQNVKAVVIATSVPDLHSADNKLSKQNDLTEKGEVINGYGDKPNRHDILTGSQPNGTAFASGKDMTCGNWTSSTDGSAMLGHSDRNGPPGLSTAKSWNAAHPSRGCSQAGLRSTGGEGLLYCFAVN
jgi:hypothetical protein